MTLDNIAASNAGNMQELYMKLNMLNKQMTELQKQIQEFEETIFEIEESKKSLVEITKSDDNKEILVPVIPGIFATARLDKVEELIVNVGSNILVGKSVDQVRKILDSQMAQTQTTQNMLIDDLQKLTVNAKDIEKDLKGLIHK